MAIIELGNGYVLEEVISGAKSRQHLPYIIGCVVRGPRGALYGLDNFGATRINMLGICKIHSLAVADNKGNYISKNTLIFGDEAPVRHRNSSIVEDMMRDFCNKGGIKYIERKHAIEFIGKFKH